jgi:predicted metal-dependent enzyme (double-stranded beta helix superfamily)
MFDVDRFVAECRAALTERTPELAIKELLQGAVAHPAAVEAALGTPSEGRIKPLHHSPELTIIQVVWTLGLVAWPHDHRMWAVIGLYGGREDNTFYRRAPEGLATVGDRRLDGGDVAVLN